MVRKHGRLHWRDERVVLSWSQSLIRDSSVALIAGLAPDSPIVRILRPSDWSILRLVRVSDPFSISHVDDSPR